MCSLLGAGAPQAQCNRGMATIDQLSSSGTQLAHCSRGMATALPSCTFLSSNVELTCPPLAPPPPPPPFVRLLCVQGNSTHPLRCLCPSQPPGFVPHQRQSQPPCRRGES